MKALGHLDSNPSLPAGRPEGVLEASLTRVVCAHQLSGTDIVDLSPVKNRTTSRVKSESPSPRKPLRATKSLPDSRRPLGALCGKKDMTGTKRPSNSTPSNERILKISRRTSLPSIHESRQTGRSHSAILTALDMAYRDAGHRRMPDPESGNHDKCAVS